MLLAVFVGSVGSAWAQTSLGKMEINSYPTNGNNGAFWLFENDNFSAGCNGLTTDTGFEKGGKHLLKLGGDGFFEINIKNNSVKVGDKLVIECGLVYESTDYDLGFSINDHNSFQRNFLVFPS